MAIRLICLCLIWGGLVTAKVAGADLEHETYVWQRAWTLGVRNAVKRHSSEFSKTVVLNAEVTWQGGEPRVTRVPIDYDTLRSSNGIIGLALRLGVYRGSFKASGEPIESLIHLAASLVRQAATNGLAVRELQIDFDCPESKLAGYQLWVEAIQSQIKPVPVTITALPSWLREPAFAKLVKAAPGYVLQVHSLERPRQAGDNFTLCDFLKARKAVEQAGQFGVPFRVALPTYGYYLAFDRAGKFCGLSAEGTSRTWPEGAQIREIRSDPRQMSALVRGWSTNRPAAMSGIIWYRLPVDADVLNWRWPTLAAVIRGDELQSRVSARAASNAPGLMDLFWVNEGNLDASVPRGLIVEWKDGDFIATDALRGFVVLNPGARRRVEFRARDPITRLAPGERCPIGWLRLSQPQEVQLEISNAE